MNLPLITIIVPVYNVEKYLERCVESLLNQSYANIEIVLVDDGSKDSSSQLCDKYRKQHPKIKVVHKENAGLGMARNTGLENASGEYVTFVDSDDWASPDLILHLWESMSSQHVDYCKSGLQRVTHDGKVLSTSQYEQVTYLGKDAATKLLPRMIGSAPDSHDSIEMCVCCVLYKLGIIQEHNIRFPSERVLISEDLVFNIEYMQHCDGACTTSDLDYFYRMNDVSLSHKYRPDRLEASVSFYMYLRNRLADLGYDRNTMFRLSRMLFIYVRMSIVQEKKSISGLEKKTSIENIRRICLNNTVQEAIVEYPIRQMGIKQRTFLHMVQHCQASILYFLADAGLV